MGHSLPEMEKGALRLPAEDRVQLALHLPSNLEGAKESTEEIEKLWIAKAERGFQNYAAVS